MKRFATQEHKTVVGVPDIVSIAVVGIEILLAIIVTLHIEHVEVAIRIGYI
jgi:hypothetical protein